MNACQRIASSSSCCTAASFSGRTAVRPVVAFSPVRAQVFAARATECPDYCILDLNGHRQLVEEGSVFATGVQLLPAQSMPGGKIRFDKVIAARQGDKFLKGAPYVQQVAVEAELVEEFSGPAPASGSSVRMGKVLVTKITHSKTSERVLQEMLSG